MTLAHAEDALQRRGVLYDRAATATTTRSAWIKATRGSDPDASLYYLAVMLEGGEDPRFIARRMVDPRLRGHRQRRPAGAPGRGAAAARRRARRHARGAVYALAQAAIYLSLAPKSNAAKRAIGAARADVREHGAAAAAGLRCARGTPARPLGRGRATTPRTTTPAILAGQELLPDGPRGRALLRTPDEAEAALAERLAEIRRARGRDA